MNESINQVILKGKIETIRRSTVNGNAVFDFSMCTTHVTKNGDEALSEYCWHLVVAFENDGVNMAGFSKGDSVLVKGRLRQSRYIATDGTERLFTEVVASSVESADQYVKIYTVLKESLDSSGNYKTDIYSTGIESDAQEYAVSTIADTASKMGIDTDPYSARELSGEGWWFRVRITEQLIRIS